MLFVYVKNLHTSLFFLFLHQASHIPPDETEAQRAESSTMGDLLGCRLSIGSEWIIKLLFSY